MLDRELTSVQRYTAFSHDPQGGNRAGVVLAAQGWSDLAMQRVATDLGYSETAFVVAARADRLDTLTYEYDRLKTLLDRAGWITVQLAWPLSAIEYRVRNAFPAGPVREDPATGAAAGAYGAYLRAHDALRAPVRLTLHQGEAMGRPSTLYVDVPEGSAGISVSGNAVALPAQYQ